jgi:hypothetical protein
LIPGPAPEAGACASSTDDDRSHAITAAANRVGRSLIAVAELLEATGKTGEALATYRRSESLLAGLAGADPSARAALAAARARIGFLLDLAGDLSAARAAHEAAMADRRALAAAHPDGIKEAVGLASSLDFYGHFHQATGQMSEALASFREGRAMIDRAAKAEPAVMSHRYLLAHLIGHVADLLWKNLSRQALRPTLSSPAFQSHADNCSGKITPRGQNLSRHNACLRDTLQKRIKHAKHSIKLCLYISIHLELIYIFSSLRLCVRCFRATLDSSGWL